MQESRLHICFKLQVIYLFPLFITGNSMTNCTARTENAMMRLERIKTDGDIVLKGKLKQCNVSNQVLVALKEIKICIMLKRSASQ
jgi:hypothetical protein